jgi:hypothetical protein
MSGVPSPEMPKDPLPRQFVIVGAVMLVVGAIGTIVLVVTNSTCNSATDMINYGFSNSGIASCGQRHSYLTIAYLVLVMGAVLIGFGGLVLPTIQSMRAREKREKSEQLAAAQAARAQAEAVAVAGAKAEVEAGAEAASSAPPHDD